MEKNNNLTGTFIFVAAIIFSVAMCFIVCYNKWTANECAAAYMRGFIEGKEQGYVDACKDFYKGKLKYDLIENPDGTREWKMIETNKKRGVQVK